MPRQSFLYLSPSPFLASKAGEHVNWNLYLSYYPFGIRWIKREFAVRSNHEGEAKRQRFQNCHWLFGGADQLRNVKCDVRLAARK